MVKNRYIQLGVRIFILAVFVAGTILSLGALNPAPNWYVYYTNISNYFCMFVVLAEVIFTGVKLARHQTKGFNDVHPGVKFAALIDIFVTMFLYNILLVDATSNIFTITYWKDIYCVLFHLVCPLLFFVDWLLFHEHGTVKWHYPFFVLILPLLYVAYILIRGSILKRIGAQSWQIIYPYFFLDINSLGYGKTALWIAVLVAIFLALSYLIFLLDNIKNFKERMKKKKHN